MQRFAKTNHKPKKQTAKRSKSLKMQKKQQTQTKHQTPTTIPKLQKP